MFLRWSGENCCSRPKPHFKFQYVCRAGLDCISPRINCLVCALHLNILYTPPSVYAWGSASDTTKAAWAIAECNDLFGVLNPSTGSSITSLSVARLSWTHACSASGRQTIFVRILNRFCTECVACSILPPGLKREDRAPAVLHRGRATVSGLETVQHNCLIKRVKHIVHGPETSRSQSFFDCSIFANYTSTTADPGQLARQRHHDRTTHTT